MADTSTVVLSGLLPAALRSATPLLWSHAMYLTVAREIGAAG